MSKTKTCDRKSTQQSTHFHAAELFGRLGKGSDYLLKRLCSVFWFAHGRLCRGRTLVIDPELTISSTSCVQSLGAKKIKFI